MKQIMSGLSVAICMERSVRLEQSVQMFEVHIVKEDGGEGKTREERGRLRELLTVWRTEEELLAVCRRIQKSLGRGQHEGKDKMLSGD